MQVAKSASRAMRGMRALGGARTVMAARWQLAATAQQTPVRVFHVNMHEPWDESVEIPDIVSPELDKTPQSQKWYPGAVRSPVIGKKMGMLQLWDEWGVRFPVTVVKLDETVVLAVNPETNKKGLIHMDVGAGQTKPKRALKSVLVQCLKADTAPKRHLTRFYVSPEAALPVGYEIKARHFVPGQFVDVQGTTKGHGFAGAMKRWGFAGQPASHGASLSHRSHGGMGGCQDPGKVFKGKKMAGRMGNKVRTQQNLQIYKIDVERDLLFIKGALPGRAGGKVVIKDAVKKHLTEEQALPFPTFIPAEGEEPVKELVMEAAKEDPFAYTGA